jgi:hypothetical protein
VAGVFLLRAANRRLGSLEILEYSSLARPSFAALATKNTSHLDGA